MQQVGVHAAAGEHADAPREAVRHVAGMVEHFLADLEPHAVLRVEQRGVARRHAEEPRIELVDVVEDHRRLDEVRVGQQLGRHAGGEQVLVAEFAARVAALAQQAPEGLEVGRAGKAARHADYGDVRFCHVRDAGSPGLSNRGEQATEECGL